MLAFTWAPVCTHTAPHLAHAHTLIVHSHSGPGALRFRPPTSSPLGWLPGLCSQGAPQLPKSLGRPFLSPLPALQGPQPGRLPSSDTRRGVGVGKAPPFTSAYSGMR